MIRDQDISIVVQGPILTHAKYHVTQEMTKVACQRLKKLFPESELILSTWENENINGITYDKVLFNADPGATWFDASNPKLLNNCNRLIVSTTAGIKAASKPYVLKVRSDLFLISKKFLTYFDRFSSYNEEYRFVKSRILAFSMWSIRGHKTASFTMPKPYHISDWAYFGYTEDLLNLYDVPLVEEPEFSQWFLNRPKSFSDIAPPVLWRMPPEQHITSSFLKKHTPIHLEHTADDSNHNEQRSTKLLMNNFLVLDQSQFFFISLKHFCFQFCRENHEWFIYHSTWLSDYCRWIPSHSLWNQLKYKTQSHCRTLGLWIVNHCLRVLNKNNQCIARISALWIKKLIHRQ